MTSRANIPTPELSHYFQGQCDELIQALSSDHQIIKPENHPTGVHLKDTYAHAHSEIFFQKSGLTDFIFPRELTPLQAGEFMLMPSAFPHGEQTKTLNKAFEQWVFMLMGDTCQMHVGIAIKNGQAPSIGSQKLSWQSKRSHGFQFLIDEAISSHNHSPKLSRELLKTLYSLLKQDLQDQDWHHHPKDIASQAINLFYDQVSNPELTIAKIAAELSCHPDHLAQCFKAKFGRSPHRFLQNCRFELAIKMMQEQQLNISEISRLCGFKRPAYFSTAFLKEFGCSPKVYRQKMAHLPLENSFH